MKAPVLLIEISEMSELVRFECVVIDCEVYFVSDARWER